MEQTLTLRSWILNLLGKYTISYMNGEFLFREKYDDGRYGDTIKITEDQVFKSIGTGNIEVQEENVDLKTVFKNIKAAAQGPVGGKRKQRKQRTKKMRKHKRKFTQKKYKLLKK